MVLTCNPCCKLQGRLCWSVSKVAADGMGCTKMGMTEESPGTEDVSRSDWAGEKKCLVAAGKTVDLKVGWGLQAVSQGYMVGYAVVWWVGMECGSWENVKRRQKKSLPMNTGMVRRRLGAQPAPPLVAPNGSTAASSQCGVSGRRPRVAAILRRHGCYTPHHGSPSTCYLDRSLQKQRSL